MRTRAATVKLCAVFTTAAGASTQFEPSNTKPAPSGLDAFIQPGWLPVTVALLPLPVESMTVFPLS